jgi:hypothetical protein
MHTDSAQLPALFVLSAFICVYLWPEIVARNALYHIERIVPGVLLEIRDLFCTLGGREVLYGRQSGCPQGETIVPLAAATGKDGAAQDRQRPVPLAAAPSASRTGGRSLGPDPPPPPYGLRHTGRGPVPH